MKIVKLEINDINDLNRADKFQKAIDILSKELNIPATIEHKEHGKEEFPFIAQNELYEMYKTRFGLLMDDLYSRVCSTVGLRPISTFKKSIDPKAPKLGKEILWNPETGLPITQKDLDRLLGAVDKFMNRNNPTKEFVINQAAVSRIISDMRKKSDMEALRKIPLKDVVFKKTSWDQFKDYTDIKNFFPSSDINRLKFRERIVGNYIQDVNDKTRKGIRDILDQGYMAGKSKGQISQDLFYKFGDLNKDWDRIIDTEGVNIFNAEYIDEQKSESLPGEPLYFVRREYGDANTCSFCMGAVQDQIIARWSDVPLSDENINDPIASIAIWDGKSNYGVKRDSWAWSAGPNHPRCRGSWDRYYEELGDIEL